MKLCHTSTCQMFKTFVLGPSLLREECLLKQGELGNLCFMLLERRGSKLDAQLSGFHPRNPFLLGGNGWYQNQQGTPIVRNTLRSLVNHRMFFAVYKTLRICGSNSTPSLGEGGRLEVLARQIQTVPPPGFLGTPRRKTQTNNDIACSCVTAVGASGLARTDSRLVGGEAEA